MNSSIVVRDLGKQFSVYDRCRPRTIMESALSAWRYTKPKRKFWALRDISFAVSPGEMLGIIGKNGAGKSTLLQVLAQVIKPDTGFVKVRGNIGSLLDLGVSLSSDLTGRENILVNGMIAGLNRKQVLEITDEIIDFSELPDFIDNPARTYSSGMKMRLAFSIAIHTSPKVLLIDEFLTVGDAGFREKCQQRISDLRQCGCTVVLVSHDAHQVKKLCSKVIWLSKGQIQDYGDPTVVVNRYLETIHGISQHRNDQHISSFSSDEIGGYRSETFTNQDAVKITRVALSPSSVLETGDPLTIEIYYQALLQVESPIFGAALSTIENEVCFSTNTQKVDSTPSIVFGKGMVSLSLTRLDLAPGKYFINVGAYVKNWESTYDFHWQKYSIQVYSKNKASGFFCPPATWSFSQNAQKSLEINH